MHWAGFRLSRASLVMQQHDDLIDALERRDREGAARVLSEHIETGLSYFIDTDLDKARIL